MDSSKYLLFAIALAALILVAPAAWAGTIRQDVDDIEYLNLGADASYASVGRFDFTTPLGNYIASGTLIDGDWVLTAAHVVDEAVSLTFTIGGTSYTGAAWAYPEGWNGDLFGGYDIGLVQLTELVPAVTETNGVEPAIRYTGSAELGETGVSVGFGMTGTGKTGAKTFDGLKRAGENVIDAVDEFSYAGRDYPTPDIFLSDFDKPNGGGKKGGGKPGGKKNSLTANESAKGGGGGGKGKDRGKPGDNVLGDATPLELEYLIAPGDSGGGVFVDFENDGSGPLLVGVNSFVLSFDGNPNSDYGDLSGHTRVSAFNHWIDTIIGNGLGSASTVADTVLRGPAGSVQAVPEPVSAALLALGGLTLLKRKRR